METVPAIQSMAPLTNEWGAEVRLNLQLQNFSTSFCWSLRQGVPIICWKAVVLCSGCRDRRNQREM